MIIQHSSHWQRNNHCDIIFRVQCCTWSEKYTYAFSCLPPGSIIFSKSSVWSISLLKRHTQKCKIFLVSFLADLNDDGAIITNYATENRESSWCQLCRLWIQNWHHDSSRISVLLKSTLCFNTLRLRQNGRYFPDDIFKCVFMDENVEISIEISLKFVPKGPINEIPALVQIMAWHRPGDKPLSEPMMVSLLTYICVTRPQWVNAFFPHAQTDLLWPHCPKRWFR